MDVQQIRQIAARGHCPRADLNLDLSKMPRFADLVLAEFLLGEQPDVAVAGPVIARFLGHDLEL